MEFFSRLQNKTNDRLLKKPKDPDILLSARQYIRPSHKQSHSPHPLDSRFRTSPDKRYHPLPLPKAVSS